MNTHVPAFLHTQFCKMEGLLFNTFCNISLALGVVNCMLLCMVFSSLAKFPSFSQFLTGIFFTYIVLQHGFLTPFVTLAWLQVSLEFLGGFESDYILLLYVLVKMGELQLKLTEVNTGPGPGIDPLDVHVLTSGCVAYL